MRVFTHFNRPHPPPEEEGTKKRPICPHLQYSISVGKRYTVSYCERNVFGRRGAQSPLPLREGEGYSAPHCPALTRGNNAVVLVPFTLPTIGGILER